MKKVNYPSSYNQINIILQNWDSCRNMSPMTMNHQLCKGKIFITFLDMNESKSVATLTHETLQEDVI